MKKTYIKLSSIAGLLFLLLLILGLNSCEKEDPIQTNTDPYDPEIDDDYSSIAEIGYSSLWGTYNLHDPSIIKYDNIYYIFSTDVAYGPNGRCGVMWRQSNDLVHWSFNGWVFNGVPNNPLEFMEANQPGYRQLSIWAPYIIKSGDKFRLYYSVPGNDWLKLACIGLATSTSPLGPWNDEGIVLSCLPSDNYNAIDPAVIVDQDNGKHWLIYGSYSSGIYIVELDPATGKILNAGDKGKRIAYRGENNDAIEGGEIIYNPEFDAYYLFVSYDWLEDNYNVRVGRSDTPEGPYLDIHSNNMADVGDNYPMITARYRFKGHAGWQGVGHCGLLKDGDDYFFVSQGRLSSNIYLMVLHVRRMVWTPDGWPVVSPNRYAGVPQTEVTTDDIVGKWEHIDLDEITTVNQSIEIELLSDGSVSGIENSSWDYEDGLLTLSLNNREIIYRARVFNEWDWVNKYRTLVYTGLTSNGQAGWGKKMSEFIP